MLTCTRIFQVRPMLYSMCIVLAAFRPAADLMAQTDTSAEQTPQTMTAQPFDPEVCFDKIWRLVNEQFWDAGFNGVDWEQAGQRYRPRALAATDHEEFAVTVNQMLAELRTSHTSYLTKWDPDYYTLQAALVSGTLAAYGTSDPSVVEEHEPGRYSSQARPHRTGIGIVTRQIDGRHFVSRVLTASPAAKAGALLGDLLLEVDGRPFHPIRSFEGRAGREVELVLQRHPCASSRLTLKLTPIDSEEKPLFEDDAEAQTRIIEHEGHRMAYLPLCWLNGWRMRGLLDRGLELAHDSEGMIIDLRHGFGGGPAIEYIDPFLRVDLRGLVEESVFRNQSFRTVVAYAGPVVVLIGGDSRSGKELLAYYFKRSGRAVLLGERTAGFVTGGRPTRICDESLLYHCVAMITVDGKRLEGVGVAPHIEVPFDIRFAAGNDIQLERAKQEMVKLIQAPD